MSKIEQPSEQSVFLVANEIKTNEAREAYLDQACKGNKKLRDAVVALLSVDNQTPDILDLAEQQSSTLMYQSRCEKEGDEVGPYKLLEQIGEGGMGSVFMAEQKTPVRRRVALKIIKPGMDSKLVIARFEAERQALAMMEHQNIAKVLDAGETKYGRPYFVMELVKGIPITEFCDRNKLTLRSRLELFQQVCNAIHHSHQKGIIHRDIKPSNILVCNYDGTPVVKVIDFGVAKATHQQLTEKTLFTQHGQVIGTLEYMSPEQAELSQLDVDTRSDIYSLGVLLYELLTGSTPLTRDQIQSTAFVEVLRVICEEEPERPSTRIRRTTEKSESGLLIYGAELRNLGAMSNNELDWIALRALEKDRNRRYESVKALSDDIDRFQHNEPVTACPPKISYRFRKFASRNKTAILIGVSIAFFLGAVGFFYLLNEREKRRIAVQYETGLAFEHAFRGNLGKALEYRSNASENGADKAWVHLLTGIVELYKDHGSSATAAKEFKEALELKPDYIAAKSLLAIAYVWQGKWSDHEKILSDLEFVTLSDDDLESHFFLGQAFMWTQPQRAVTHLELVHKTWFDRPLVRMMLAEALGHLAWDKNDENIAKRGIEMANSARNAMLDNKSVIAVCNWCYLVQANIRRSKGKPFDGILDETKQYVERLHDFDEFLVSYPCRAWYYHLRGTEADNRQAVELWKHAVTKKNALGWYKSCYAAEMYRQGKAKSAQAWSEIEADSNDPVGEVARVFLAMDGGNIQDARTICNNLGQVDESLLCAYSKLVMLLRLGDLEAAKAICREIKTRDNEPNSCDVILGNMTAAELFERSFKTRLKSLNARLQVAIFQMATGETENALETLRPAVAMGGKCVIADPAHWAQAFSERPFHAE